MQEDLTKFTEKIFAYKKPVHGLEQIFSEVLAESVFSWPISTFNEKKPIFFQSHV